MITANLATYPPRREFLIHVVAALNPQVDRINVVLNEYDSIPEDVASFEKVNVVIPHHDIKDVGKFYFDVSDSDFVFLVDDDIVYPDDYVEKTIGNLSSFSAPNFLAGYHCSIYQKPAFPRGPRSLKRFIKYYTDSAAIANYRRTYLYSGELSDPIIVDQVGTGTAVIRGKDMPPFDYMRTSQKFVDVRIAKWCFDRGINRVCLPRLENWLESSANVGFGFGEEIFLDFTQKNPQHVAREISHYAFKTPNVGQRAS